jgi:hypothetical protein
MPSVACGRIVMFVQYTFPTGYTFKVEYLTLTKEELQNMLQVNEDPLNHAIRLGTIYQILN